MFGFGCVLLYIWWLQAHIVTLFLLVFELVDPVTVQPLYIL